MKKLLLAVLLTSTSTLAMAQISTDGLYVQGNVGVSKLNAKADGEKFFKRNATQYTIAVGKDMGTARLQADYTNFGNFKENGSKGKRDEVGYKEWKNSLKIHSLGVSAIHDIKTTTELMPYVGVRVGVNQLKFDGQDLYNKITPDGRLQLVKDIESKKSNKVGVGAIAGVQYAFNPQLALDAGVEYHYLGKIVDAKVNQYGAKVGLRYNF
ncbi:MULTISPECIES: opacity family porin [Moraxella]|uniref:Porin opacity type domain-containing protein n=1 Tax=Moraxella lacunata TaxID=477 RepID=A0A1B8PZP3_MORLA|nr:MULTISPECIES: opacity family porin [Moraxella]MBE9578232.1 outer membrane beta-barrel protein [Moraxella sp. K1664]MBE9588871.1 outer membrane beta-barrel protein [Moraxella sp. K1630]MBE9597083.1 outer membrane beta-barrel protein [Moraxella sp. K2450]MDH9219612.1 opacity family porin [Moraxella lacunata]MDI4483531.1 porin [Moraxella lacunata]